MLQHMVVPIDQEGKVGDCPLLHRDASSSASLEPINTRKAGGRKADVDNVVRSCFMHVITLVAIQLYNHFIIYRYLSIFESSEVHCHSCCTKEESK